MKAKSNKERNEATTGKTPYKSHEVIVGPICTCRSFRFPHELKMHKKLKSDSDWRDWKEISAERDSWGFE